MVRSASARGSNPGGTVRDRWEFGAGEQGRRNPTAGDIRRGKQAIAARPGDQAREPSGSLETNAKNQPWESPREGNAQFVMQPAAAPVTTPKLLGISL